MCYILSDCSRKVLPFAPSSSSQMAVLSNTRAKCRLPILLTVNRLWAWKFTEIYSVPDTEKDGPMVSVVMLKVWSAKLLLSVIYEFKIRRTCMRWAPPNCSLWRSISRYKFSGVFRCVWGACFYSLELSLYLQRRYI